MINVTQISNIINAQRYLINVPDEMVAYLCIDSRSVFETNHTLYFALQGPRTNGHQYIAALYEMGVRQFVVENLDELTGYADVNYWLVPDTLVALQTIASYQRSLVDIPIIGITGSNGKTIVKEWLNHGLRDGYKICRSPKSYNSQIGVPLSVWNLKSHHTLGIFEAGISQPKEMDVLEKIIQPNIGVFTHLGSAHQDQFLNQTHKAQEKLTLFKNCEVLFYPSDNDDLQEAITTQYKYKSIRLFDWSYKHSNAWMYVVSEQINNNHCFSTIRIGSQDHELRIPFNNAASLNNAYACVAVWHYLNLDWSTIQSKLKTLPKLGMRLELLKGINQCTIINDAYSLDIDSLGIALDFQHLHNEHHKKIVVLSDLPGLTNDQEAYEQLAGLIKAAHVHQFIAVGKDYRSFKYLFKDVNTTYINNTIQLIDYFKKSMPEKCTILVKGARKYGFEQVVKALEQFEHQTRMEINLNAIQHNLNCYKALLKPKTKIMVMVKAFSYGSGSHEIAQWLQFNKVDYLAVAFTNEAVSLRTNGVRVPIMIMNAEPGSFEQIITYRLEPEIYSLSILKKFIQVVSDSDLTFQYPVHIKLETGMNRLGFSSNEIPELIALLASNKHVKVASLFSHLAGSDESLHDDFTKKQIKIFEKVASHIENSLGYDALKHIANSAAISRFPEAQFDMVRLGIGLYGHTADEHFNKQLQVVAQLKTTITQIKEVAENNSIGYGRQFTTNGITKIATLPIGYADGLKRGLNLKKAFVMVHGKPAYYVGNICMDMCMIDATNIPCSEGDEIVIFGQNPSLIQLSEWYNTIPYEVISNISQRVKRIYFKE